MDKFLVGNDEYFQVTCWFQPDNKELIREVRIAWIRTQLEEIGPHKGDRLVAIDGKKMEGLRLEELKELLHINPAIGETRVFSFEGRRGLLRKRVYPELTFTGVDKTKRVVSANTGPTPVLPAN